MKVIAIANHKGGVAKTTTAANLGIALSRKGYKTLAVDLDAQSNLTSLLLREEPTGASIYEALIGEVGELPIVKVEENLDIVPSSLTLARVEGDIQAIQGKELLLASLLSHVGGEYDYILLDCPPGLGIVTTNALVAATDLYIPITAETLPARGLATIEDFLLGIKRLLNPRIEISGIIVTRYQNRNLNKGIVSGLRNHYGNKVFSTMIRDNVAISEATLYGKDIYTYAPGSNGAKDYDTLAEEVIERTRENR